MTRLAENLITVWGRIESAALAAKREPEEIQLLAVSKLFPASAVEEAMHAGQTRFGENYVQEGVEKIIALAKLRPWLEWHFIGPLQSNKTRDVAHHFDWVQSIDRLKIAERLSAQRLEIPGALPLQVCVQVNISNEESKSGVPIEQTRDLCDAITQLPGLHLRGLMAIPAPSSDPQEQRAACHALQTLFTQIREARGNQPSYASFDTLSMGMSDDLEAAIAQGSTMVRVGTAIFGNRVPVHP